MTYTPSAIGAGPHTLTAGYGGDRTHVLSSGQMLVVVGRSTSTTVTCTPGSIVLGQHGLCTATVTDIDTNSTSTMTPTGTITFATNKPGIFDATTCGLSGEGGAYASCQVDYTPTVVGGGRDTITATYGGDSSHTGSTGQTVLIVLVRPTITAISCVQTKLRVGQSTLCSVTVTDIGPLAPSAPTGPVTVTGSRNDTFGGNPCTLMVSVGAANCSLTYTPIAVGRCQHTITARYYGDRSHHGSRGQTTIAVTP